jgi:hypothetical protein
MGEMRGEDEKRWAGETLNGLHSYSAHFPNLEARGCPRQTYNRVPFLASVADVIMYLLIGEYSRQKKVNEWAKFTNVNIKTCHYTVYTEATNNR